MELNSRNRYLLSTLLEFKFYLIIPAMAGAVLALIYVLLLQSQSWTSRQRLMVRDDLLGQAFKPGQFSSFDTMKSRQETILDVARNPEVIRATLQQLGPSTKSWFFGSEGYPDDHTIEQMQGQINLSAPNGAEFGTTEVVVLSVKAPSAKRSADLISTLLVEVEQQVESVRVSQLQSMESELIAARDNARNSLKKSIDKLREMENILGPDSVAMATMTSSMPGDNSIKSELLQILAEKRGFEAQLESLKASQKTLEESQSNPLLVMTSAASFFRDQVKISELAKKFVNAQGSFAVATGRYESTHPLVQAAAEQLDELKNQIANEFSVLSISLDSRVVELEQQIARLDDQIDQNHQRLMNLNDKRGDHLAINSEIAKRTEMLNQFETDLENVQSYHQGAGKNVWITRMGEPQIAAQADGMGKRSTVMAGGFLGLLFGAGLIVLLAPPYSPTPTDVLSGNAAGNATQGSATTSNSRQDHRSMPSLSHSDSSKSSVDSQTNRTRSDRQLQSNSARANEVVPLSETESSRRSNDKSSGGDSCLVSKSNVIESSDSVSSSVTIPDVSDDRADRVEELLAKQQAHRTPVPEIVNLEFAKEATSRMNAGAANPSVAAPDELLAALRAKRASETDPLAKLNLAGTNSENSLESVQKQVSELQQSCATTNSRPESRPGIQTNLFFNKSWTTNRASIPDQVKNLSDSILGLVQPKSKEVK